MLNEFIIDIKSEFFGYSIKSLIRDIIAGLTVSAVALPLALAFGAASGASAAAGVVAAIISCIFAGILSGGYYQISGPTGAMIVSLTTVFAGFGIKGILITGFLAGLFLFAAGFLKVGKILKFIPSSVILGFTSGIALTIMLGQIDNFFGTTSTGTYALQKIWSYTIHGVNFNTYSIIVSALSVIIMLIWPKKLSKTIPAPLFTIVIMYLACVIFKIDVPVVGSMPSNIILADRLSFSDFNLDILTDLAASGLGIASLVMVESLMCGANVGKTVGKKLNSDRELIAQGISNMIIPFFGGMPATAAASRSVVSVAAGAKTRLAAVFQSIFLILVVFFLSDLISGIPLPVLAGILMVVAFRMNDIDRIKDIFKKKNKVAISKYLITMLSTIVFNLTIAIVLGVIYSMFDFMAKLSDIDISISDVDTEKLDGINRHDTRGTCVVYITGPLFFATVEKMETELTGLIKHKNVIFSLRGVPLADTSGMYAFYELMEKLVENNVNICFASVQPKVLEQFKANNILKLSGENNVFWDSNAALHNLFGSNTHTHSGVLSPSDVPYQSSI